MMTWMRKLLWLRYLRVDECCKIEGANSFRSQRQDNFTITAVCSKDFSCLAEFKVFAPAEQIDEPDLLDPTCLASILEESAHFMILLPHDEGLRNLLEVSGTQD